VTGPFSTSLLGFCKLVAIAISSAVAVFDTRLGQDLDNNNCNRDIVFVVEEDIGSVGMHDDDDNDSVD